MSAYLASAYGELLFDSAGVLAAYGQKQMAIDRHAGWDSVCVWEHEWSEDALVIIAEALAEQGITVNS